MTISSVELTQEGSSLVSEGKDALRIHRNYSSQYRVLTDDPTTSTAIIEDYFRTHNSLPWHGRAWKWTSSTAGNDSDPDSICKKIEVSHQAKSTGVFTVVCSFEPLDGGKQDTEKPDNEGKDQVDPLLWADLCSISYTQITVPVMWAEFLGFTKGLRGDEFAPGTNLLRIGSTKVPQNSALVPYDPLPEKEVTIKVIRFTSNVENFDTEKYDPWLNTVNSDKVLIHRPLMRIVILPLQGRMKSVSASNQFENGKWFVKREVEIWVHPDGWRGRLANLGFQTTTKEDTPEHFSPGYLDEGNYPQQTEQQTAKDASGYPMTSPMKLNGYGKLLRSDKTEDEVWTNWRYYEERPWQPIAGEL